ncbi:hypothetical protein KR093_003419 [Drosophila rubida]|uniref:Uncharacterized protein n=1 Tax=Drosophila rubida TaxID=30044 RepID=A0AAD4K3Y3_9MUSC|nr:hypothetical protein KR093_003419 [Drosophila rubida]
MKPIVQWLVGIAAGVLAGTQTIRMFKVVNEDNEYYCPHRLDVPATVPDDAESEDLPYIMGSEQISAALQQILSSDEQNPRIMSDEFANGRMDCELGSESLNRMLEEMMTSSTSNGNEKLIHFDPVMRL